MSRKSNKKKAFRQNSPTLRKLEDRILFDAAMDAGMDPNAGDASQSYAHQNESTQSYEQDVATYNDESDSSQQETSSSSDAQVRNELVIVDTSVDDYQQLVDDLMNNDDDSRNIEVVLLDADADGVEQVSQILSQYNDLDALHLVTHGDDAAFRLGNVWVTADNLDAYAGQISGWGDALTSTGDLLIYGCDLAESAEGRQLVDSLAELTDLDIAASDDDTGSSHRGGDWQLEYTNGDIETSVVFSRALQASYDKVLAAGPEVQFENASQDVQLGEDFEFTITFDNTGTDVGYGPFIDLIFPVNGEDGAAGTDTADGIDFVGATYLGQALNTIELTFPDDDGAGIGTTGTIDHPFAVDAAGDPLQITGTAGDKLVVVELPFGSFAPDQPEADIVITATTNNLADLGTEMTIQARSGFRYGEDPLDNPTNGDPSIVSDSNSDVSDPSVPTTSWSEQIGITPTLISLEKIYLGPENETATGPNHEQQYRIDVDIADGQTISNLDIIDSLPNNIVVTSIDEVRINGVVTNDYTDNLSSLTFPGNNLDLIITPDNDVVGTTDARDVSVTFTFYVAEVDADGDRVIPLSGEDDTTSSPDSRSLNNARAVGDWTPIDIRDTGGTDNAVADPGPGPEHTLDDKAIAIQKSVNIVNDTGTSGASPGDTLEYVLNFQISDYYTFGDLVIDDIFQDGQLFDFGFGATFDITDMNGNVTGSFTVRQVTDADGGETLVVDQTQIDNSDNTGEDGSTPDGSDGSTTLRFDISQALIDNGATDGILQGGLSDGANQGAATGTIRFRTIIQDQFADTFPSGDRSVDQGDSITNNSLTISGTVRENAEDGDINSTTGVTESDTSSASVTIQGGSLAKEVYAINGNTTLPTGPSGKISITPGDVVTYRIEYNLATSDFENLTITDFLPLPIFDVQDHNADGVIDANDNWTFNIGGSFDGTAPVSGVVEFGSGDTFYNSNGTDSNIIPTITVGPGGNSLELDFGNYDDPSSSPNTIELYISVTAQDAPTADGLFLTNVVRAEEGTTNGTPTVIDRIVQVEVLQPELTITKGIVSTDNPNAEFENTDPRPDGITFGEAGSADPLFSGGTITSEGLNGEFDNDGNLVQAGQKIDNNIIGGIDAGDTIRYAIVLENVGNSTRGAYDVQISDSLPDGFSLVGGSVQIVDGTGAALTYTGAEADLFTTGIEIDDPGATPDTGDGTNAGAIDGYSEDSGRNVVIIFYDVTADNDVQATQTYTNTASLTNYAGNEGGDNHAATPLTDEAFAVAAGFSGIKSIVSTSESHTGVESSVERVTIGEIVRYRIQVALPEGTLTDFQIQELMPTGLTFIDDGTTLVSFVSDNDAITSSTLVGAGYYASGNESNVASITPTDALGDSGISIFANSESDNYASSGQDVFFKLGDIVNTDNDANTEYVIVEFNALVDNTSAGSNDGGTSALPDSGEVRDNSFRVLYDANDDGDIDTSADPDTSERFFEIDSGDRPRIQIAEPSIENIDKTADVSGGDAGDVVTYTISFDVADGEGRSDAFDIRVLDTLPSELSGLSFTEIRVGGSTLSSGFTNNTSGDTLDLTIDQVAKGTTVEVEFTATIQSGISPGDVITNDADITWSSLPGEYGTDNGSGGNSTGSDLQSLDGTNTGNITYNTGSGDDYGERNGDNTGNNDYLGDDSYSLTIDSTPAITKTLDGTSINSNDNGANDAVIGEIVTYTVTLNLNEVTLDNAQLVDTLDAGLAFVDVTNVATTGGVTFTGDANNPDSVTTNGRVITWDLGTISDSTPADGNGAGDSDGTIAITYRAIVTNVATNQDSQTLDNSVTFTWDDDPGTAPNPRETLSATADNDVTIVEPTITIAKTADVDVDGDGFDDGTTADAGDDIRYTIVLTNTSGVDAFDLSVTDELPLSGGTSTILNPTFTVVDSDGVYNASDFSLTGDNTNGWTLQSTSNIDFAADSGRTITIQIEGVVSTSIQPDQVVSNEASVTWHSIDGDIAVGDQSSHTTDDTERTGDDGEAGSPNNYESIDSADITILSPTILKQIVSTSIDNGTTNTDAHATIGEYITYSITIDVPEAGIPTVEIIDQLDAGLEFVSLDSIVASPSVSTDAAGDDFATTSNFNPTVTGDGSSATPYGLTFDLGTITNSDNDNTVTEQITLTYTVKVMNSVDADGNGNAAGDSLTNTARMEWNSGASQTADESVSIEVVEADLNVDKQLTTSTTADAGDTVSYTITISHTANSDTDAFDVTFSDTLPDEINFSSFTATHDSLGDISALFEFDSGSNTLRTISGQSFDQNFGDDVVITVTGTLITAETEPGETISNTANIQWSSLDGDNPSDGDDANERGGDGTDENDYNDSSTNTALSIATPSVAKSLVGTSVNNASNASNQAVVGETATYQVILSLAEGTYNSLQLLDTLASGYDFISIDSIVRSSTNITTDLGTGDFSDLATFNPSTSGGDHIFDLGTVTNAEDASGDETLTITYTVRVNNTAGNDGNGSSAGTALDNAAQLEWTADGSTTNSNTSSAANVEVIEPDLAIVKTINDDTPNLGDTVTFTLEIDHMVNSDTDAFDLVISDTLPSDLVLDTGTIVVTLGGSTLTDGVDYTLATGSNGFTITGIDLLDNGQTLEVTYDADLTTDTADANGTYNNTGNLTWTSIDGASANERDGDGGNGGEDDYASSSTESLTITQPDLRVTKENGVAAVVPGVTYTYDIVVHNDGTDTATGINVQDFLNGNVFDLTSVSTNDAGNVTYDSGTGELNWDAGSINAGSSKTLEVTVTVLSALDAGIDNVTNSATATHDDIDPTNNNTGTDTDTVDANPILTLTKTDSRTEADLNDTLTYTLNYANTGNQDATGVQIIETVPTGTTFAGTAGWTDIGGGQYRFDVGNLAAGANGSVTFEVTVNDPQPVGQHTISNSATIDDDNTNGGTAGIDATATDDTDVPSSIAGRVYNDFDNDSVFDAGDGEHGIGGVRIELYDTSSGSPVFVSFVNTAADGTYSFTGLLGDQYEIRQTQPTNYNDGLETDGSEANGDTSTNDRISSIELNAGIDATDYNFGERGVSIEGTVFVDDDRDGAQQGGETTGISGVTVELYDSTGTTLLDTTTTDANGNYSFDNLAADDYIIRQTHPTQYTSTSSDQINATVPLAGLTDQDFGEALFDLGDFVWFDANNDGLQAGEEGLAGVDVTLTYAGADGDISTTGDNIVYNTTTDANGFYSFTELFNGNYTVEIDAADLPSGVTGTAETDDSSAAIDGTSNITIGGSDRFDVDFGYTGGGSIGDFVFLDVDGDGVQDPEDVGLADVTVNILFAGADGIFGNDDDLSFTTVTDSNGGYSVDNLPGGDFQVSVDTGDSDLPGSITGVSGTESNSGTANVTLADNETNDDIDFGLTGTLSLGDRLWFDGNGDGVQDPTNEPGLAEVDVTLTFAGQDGIFGNADDVTLTDTTDANGNYQFNNLADGEYRITYNSLDLPEGMTATHEIDDSAAAVDGTSNITLGGSNRDDVDFGFQGAGSIGDFVWHDVDGDGVQDAGEPGLANITVDLEFAGDDGVFGTGDDFSLTTETDANGAYSFDNLADGNYRVNVDTTDADLPSNVTGVSGTESISGTANVTLDAVNGRNQDDIDFGFAGTQSVGDFVWFDADGDGVQDAGEPGLGDVAVTLTSAGQDGIFGNADDYTINTTTDANGGYNFGLLPDGDYRVALDTNDLPTGLTQTAETNDGADTLAQTAEFTVNGSDRDDIDFGYTGALTIGDTVYYDADGDGTQNGGEPGVEGVDVTLNFAGEDGVFGTDDDFQLTTTTDADGNYSFDNLPEGDYELTVDGPSLPDGMTTITEEFDDTGAANDGTATVTLTSGGGDNNDVDFGFMGTGSIGDTVFWDQNGDDVQNNGEIGLEGLTVAVDIDYDSDGTIDHTLTTTTDANGQYLFENLPAGEFTVRVTPPAGTTQTADADGLSSADQSTYDLSAGESIDNQDFGYAGNSSVGDQIFWDVDGDGGAFDPTEDRGLSGVTVQLDIDVDGDGSVDYTTTTVTDIDGNYSFDNLIAGDYTVTVDDSTVPGDMGNNPLFDADGGNDHSTDITLPINSTDNTADFGYTGTATLGDHVFLDTNGDGIDAGSASNEPGLANVDVQITWAGNDGTFGTADDEVFTTTTDDNGDYDFANLASGDYRVDVIESTAPPTSSVTTGNDTHDVNLSEGEDHNDSDFGFVGSGTIGDFVFYDHDGDGAYNPAIDGMYPGVVITLTGDVDGDGVDETFQTTTDANGNYSFPGLPEGNYTVTITPPSGTTPTADASGSQIDGVSNVVLDATNPSNSDQDFGLTGTGTIGDTVFFDIDGDGVQTGAEPGIPGVTVTIEVDLDGDGNPDFTTTAVTDQNGNYTFDNIPAGTSTITVTDPTGGVATTDHDGTPGGDNSNEVTLPAGDTDLTSDFGYDGTGSIGDTVFWDQDNDGVQDADEAGLPGVTVELDIDFNSDGTVDHTLTTTTDANGQYLFEELPAGQYTVRVTQPAGTTQTYDNDGLSTPNQSTYDLSAGESIDNQDFGYAGNSSIGDQIFWDVDGDGAAFDPTEDRGLSGVTVQLDIDVDGDGSVDYTTTTVTDVDGNYSFDNLIAGDYTISVDESTVPGDMGNNPLFDADGGNDHTTDITLPTNSTDNTADFGYTGTATIGDHVFLDTNGDGIDAGSASNEPGLANVDVQITWAGNDGTFGTADDEVFTTTTDDNGDYDFVNLASSDYRVDVLEGTAPPTSSVTTGNDTHDVNLSEGEDHNDSDFGFVGTGSIGDFVYYDHDGDGAYDPAIDAAYPDVIVTLTGDVDGDGIDETFTTTTDANGNYSFPGIPEGDYTVTVTQPNGTNPSADASGPTDGVSNVTLDATNPTSSDQDFGLTGTGTIGETVFYDIDGDGVQDIDEPGIPGVTVTIEVDLNGDGNPDFTTTAVTDQNGNYTFDNIPEGNSTVTVTSPDGTIPTTDHDGTAGGDVANDVTLPAGGTDLTSNFGFNGTGSIGDTVFWDQNADGVQDANEAGLPGVTVELDIDFNQDGTVDHTLTTTTDANGQYNFGDLPAGEYTVRVTQPAGTTPTYDDDGLATPNQSTYELASGQDVDNKDFGYSGNSSIGDTIFFDYSGDGGPFNPGDNDRGIEGVDVTLEIDVDGDGSVDVTRTTTTDANGNYLFENLIDGDYTITVDSGDLPDAMGLNPTFDADGTPDSTTDVVLGVNETNDSTDFGYHATPDYVITKDDRLSNVVPGQTINYTITLTNAGTFRGQNVIVTDTFPTNILENVSATVNGVASGTVDMTAGTITWNLPSVAMGETVNIVVTADVINPLATGITSLTNSVEVADNAFNGVDPDTTNNSDNDINTVTAQPDYQIVKTNDLTGPAVPGQTFNYFLQVTNNGDQEGTGVVVTDTLPIGVLDALSVSTDDAANVTYDSATGDLVWNAGSIVGGGGTKTLTVTVTVQDPVGQLAVSFDNSASVTDDGNNGADPDLTDNTSTNTAGLDATPDYEIFKTSNLTETPMVGDSFEYTITVRNIGNQNGTGVTVTDMIPVSVLDRNNVTTDDPANVNYDASTGELIWNVGDLDGRGDSATLTIFVTIPFVVEDPLADEIVNTATVTDDGLNGPDFVQSNNSSTRVDEVTIFAFDGINNFSDPVNAFSANHYFGDDARNIDRTLRPVPVDPIFSGLAEPGTTLNLKIYDEQCNVIGERQVVADAGGNWVANFPNAVIWKHPHRMDVEQTAPIRSDVNQVDGFNMRRYFHPATHASLFFTERDTVHSIERGSAYQTINSMHEANNSPLQVGWRNHLYQLNVSSTNASSK